MVERGIIEPIIHSPVDGPLRQAFEAAQIPVWLCARTALRRSTTSKAMIG